MGRLPYLAMASLALLAVTGAAPVTAQSAGELDRRLTIVERKLESETLSQMVNELQELREAMSRLRGQMDVVQRDLTRMEERQRQIYADLDDRLQTLETGELAGATAPPSPTAPVAPDPSRFPADAEEPALESPPPATTGEPEAPTLATTTEPETPASTPDDDRSEAEHYREAFETLRAGNYARAADQFEFFLERFPEGQYSANARYWLGESHYVVREFDTAQNHFERVLADFPDSPKASDAMLKVGFVHYEEGRLDRARDTLQQVIAEFPGTTAASLAQQRLDRLGG